MSRPFYHLPLVSHCQTALIKGDLCVCLSPGRLCAPCGQGPCVNHAVRPVLSVYWGESSWMVSICKLSG